ncbi:MAG: prepilin peptidase, partial [Lacipirellulaceae bacterium]
MPPTLALLLVFALGLALGGLVNWATYTLAWNPRPISPWSEPPEKVPPRTWLDRVPVYGWMRLSREAGVHGRVFWVRPLIVEMAMAVVLAWLYWWEVDQQGLVRTQFAWLFPGERLANLPKVPTWTTYCTFFSHTILITLMAAASLIDIDEKIIPDEITVIGTLVGLLLAAALPMALLPQVAAREVPAPTAVEIELPAGLRHPPTGDAYLEPTTWYGPNSSRTLNKFVSSWQGLVTGLACWSLWLVALT